jgi:O-succinylbenzoate synthase
MPFAVTLRIPFRGLIVREGMVIQGPRGWGEFAPFDEYSDVRAARWLVSAVEAAYAPWPDVVRSAVSVNAIIPGVDASTAGLMAREAIAESGCTVTRRERCMESGAGDSSVASTRRLRNRNRRTALRDAG